MDQLRASTKQNTVSIHPSSWSLPILTRMKLSMSALDEALSCEVCIHAMWTPYLYVPCQPSHRIGTILNSAQFSQLRAHLLPGLSHRLVQHDPKPTRPIRHAWHAHIHLPLLSASCALPSRSELHPQAPRTSCCRISRRVESAKTTTTAAATATCAAAVARAWRRASGLSPWPFQRLLWEVEDPSPAS